jgi:DUF4097 and DUF4098 domain-containing protein YvlB
VFELIAQYWPFVLIAWGLLRLVEVAFTRGDSPRSSFSGGEVVLMALICFFGWGIWEGYQHGIRIEPGGLDWFGEQYDYPVTASAPAAGMRRVVFDDPHGNIKVVGGDGQTVTVTGHKTVRAYNRGDADQTNGNTPVEIVAQGDRLLVRTNQDHAPDNQRVTDDLEVTIPRGMAVESHGNQGDFDIADVSGDIDLATSRGDVRLARIGGNARLDIGRSDLIRATDVKGRIDLQGRGSDVDLENIDGPVTIGGAYTGTLDFKNLAQPLQFEGARNTELSAQAVPGHISMDLGQLNASGITGPMRLVSGNRDIKLEQFTQSLELETQRGDIELQPGLPMPSMEVRAGSGRIELIVPDKAGFRLDATAEHGEVVNDFGPPVEREVDGRTATLKAIVGEGPLVRLTTSRGQIEIRKEGTSASDAPETPAAPKAPKTPSAKELKDSEVKM